MAGGVERRGDRDLDRADRQAAEHEDGDEHAHAGSAQGSGEVARDPACGRHAREIGLAAKARSPTSRKAAQAAIAAPVDHEPIPATMRTGPQM